ncbi:MULTISPECIES: hypothetical protein [Methylomicrobium]|nr:MULTISPECIES: hypothetical protein [Methylomicrobium]
MQRFQTRRLSFAAFAWMVVLALGFGLLWWVSDWAILPVNLTFIAALGSVGFGLLALAELFVQGVEHLAARLSHESTYYWTGLILIALIIANQRDFMINYWLMLFSIVLLIRWVVVGSMRMLIRNK